MKRPHTSSSEKERQEGNTGCVSEKRNYVENHVSVLDFLQREESRLICRDGRYGNAILREQLL